MDADTFDRIVEAIVQELTRANQAGRRPSNPPGIQTPQPAQLPQKQSDPVGHMDLSIDLDDPTTEKCRNQPGVDHPADADGLQALMAATPARIGYGRAGPRYRTAPWLLFQADQAVTQDTLFRDVDDNLLSQLGLFKVQTCITGGKQEYLLRPDLGRRLSEESRQVILQKCKPNPQVQVCIGDGLSAQAIEANIDQILPVIQQGCQTTGLSMGTPFFIQYCRVGVMNDIGDLLHPEVLMLLIGERPGLGRADSMSIYMAYKPQSGHTDAERDVICNVFNGGTNPLEAGAYAVQFARKMIRLQAAGVKLKLAER
jgi:ethanolamine ammonia-lyase small subunit